MNNTQQKRTTEKKFFPMLILVIVSLAAFSSAINDLNQLRAFSLQASNFIAAWSDVVVPTANASVTAPLIANSCVQDFAVHSFTQNVVHSDEFRWSGVVAPGAAIEVQGINGEINAESTAGAEVQVVAVKKSHRSDVNLVQVKVEQHAGGVTICALYPDEDGNYPSSCSGGNNGERKESSRGTGNLRNNDVQVDFMVKVPARVGFVGKTVNGGISATSLSGNVSTRTVNGSIKISTTGYADAATVNGEIVARLGDGNWPKSLSFRTVNGEINLDLPANLSAAVDAETLNGSINSDFPLNVTNLKGKRSLKGNIGSGGRELLLKTLNGSINLRIAS